MRTVGTVGGMRYDYRFTREHCGCNCIVMLNKEMLEELDRIGEEVAKTETREEPSRQKSEK